MGGIKISNFLQNQHSPTIPEKKFRRMKSFFMSIYIFIEHLHFQLSMTLLKQILFDIEYESESKTDLACLSKGQASLSFANNKT